MTSVKSVLTGLPGVQRADGTNPFLPQCRRHLRRICGVCENFTGASMVAEASCTKLGGARRGVADAASCSYWARRSAREVS